MDEIDKNIKCTICGRPVKQIVAERDGLCEVCYNAVARMVVDPKTLQKL